jgi:hypothetical protein
MVTFASVDTETAGISMEWFGALMPWVERSVGVR